MSVARATTALKFVNVKYLRGDLTAASDNQSLLACASAPKPVLLCKQVQTECVVAFLERHMHLL